MRTVKKQLKKGLSKKDYEKAEKYESENWDWKAESFEDALLDAFTWDKTDEGWNYWDKIFSNGGSLQPDLNTQEVDNNGWIKVESETDLPKDFDDFWVINDSGEIHMTEFNSDYKEFYGYFSDRDGKVTHYQPIIKPLPPKF